MPSRRARCGSGSRVLVDSHRLTDADRAAWAILEAGDRRRRVPARVVAAAKRAIREFLDSGDAYVSCSWGKDSVVIAHLARSVSAAMPIRWIRMPGQDNPDCESVRDEFLGSWPMPYDEIVADQPRRRGWVRRTAESKIGGRRITGIRAAESITRELSARAHGVATADVCRPILRWTTPQVFAYLAQHDLPVHPAYAMTRGGELDRDWLRVASIGGDQGSGRGRWGWERDYYGDDTTCRGEMGMFARAHREWTTGSESGLYAELLADGWSVVDPDGGRWWPDESAAREILASDDQAAAAVRIAREEPMRGKWHT